MSRYIKHVKVTEEIQKQLREILDINFNPDQYELAYGYDHALFYFYQFFDKEGEIFLEEDGLFDKLTGQKLGSMLQLFDCQPHSQMCFLDFPF